MSLPRMRTVNEAIAEIKAHDPNTALTQNALRVLVVNEVIPYVKVGKKKLVNLDTVEDYLCNPAKYINSNESSGKIRRII